MEERSTIESSGMGKGFI